jgi:hypothetical protein
MMIEKGGSRWSVHQGEKAVEKGRRGRGGENMLVGLTGLTPSNQISPGAIAGQLELFSSGYEPIGRLDGEVRAGFQNIEICQI